MHGNKIRASIAAWLLLAAVAAATIWLRAGYAQNQPRQIAADFQRLLKSGQFQAAFQLSVQHGFVGHTAAELETIARRQCLDAKQFKYTFPFQSNGNRLRRWLAGKEVEIEQVSVELEGPCLLEIRLKHMAGNEWRVVYFASHAG